MLGNIDVREKGGFTLIELAIVLIIIGLILGAVLKGRDLIESAKIKKVYTKFVEAWDLAVLNYQDRTGQLLGDGIANGGTAATPDGEFDNIKVGTTIINRLKSVGLTPPPDPYYVKGKYYSGNVNVYLGYNVTRGENIIIFSGMPTDVAIALDTIIDGESNGQSGEFLYCKTDTTTPSSCGYSDWPDASSSTTKTVSAGLVFKY